MHPSSALIPHEPVLVQLLSGDELEQAKCFLKSLQKNQQKEILKLLASSELDNKDSELTNRLLSNSTYFAEKEILGILNYTLDSHALKIALTSSPFQVLPAAGRASRESFTYGCSILLPQQLETNFIEFPGHHGGYNSEVHHEFAEKLHDVICRNRGEN